MKLKLIIFLLLASTLCFGQDSLHMDSVASPAKTYVKKTKKKRKKPNPTQPEKEQAPTVSNTGDQPKPDYSIVYIILSLVAFVAIYKLVQVNKKPAPSDYPNKPVMSDAWARMLMSRGDYYREVYLKSNEWKRKRFVVLRRDNWRCVHCGARATQVHHKKYAPKNIGKEPIEWLESVCKSCHDSLHS